MSLNKAMVDLYKQKSARRASRQSASKPAGKLENLDSVVSQSIVPRMDLKPGTKFEHLFGLEHAREDIMDIVNLFKQAIEKRMRKPELPLLICGSSGLGKTSLVEAAANQAQLNLVPIQLSELDIQSRNEFKDSLEHLIRHILANQPAIALIDNLEELADREECKFLVRRAMKRLLKPEVTTLIICTTSALDAVSGMKFLMQIHLNRPRIEARRQILTHLQSADNSLAHLTEKCIEDLARDTPSFTAEHLKIMISLAQAKSHGMPTMVHFERAIDLVKQSFKRGSYLVVEKPPVTWSCIGGMSDVRQAFKDMLRQARRSGRFKCAGAILHGPPGCGKTMVAQAMANEAGFNFMAINAAELFDKFLGSTEKNIKRVFQEAREHQPCILYFDEFDGLCGKRRNKDNLTSAISILLSLMDGFNGRGEVIILASTNSLKAIDPAVRRSGRLSEHIYVGPPDEKARRDILRLTTNNLDILLADDVDLDEWARKTHHFTGANIRSLVEKAEARAWAGVDIENSDVRSCESSSNLPRKITVSSDHFEYASNEIKSRNIDLAEQTRPIKRKKMK